MKRNARLYHCARCHRQVVICRHCDRGHRYCKTGCAQQARRKSLRRAHQKYQSSRKGRLANAHRQHRFRQRQRKKVTHQTSTKPVRRDSLLMSSNALNLLKAFDVDGDIRCHFCGCDCEVFLRNHFLRPPSRGR